MGMYGRAKEMYVLTAFDTSSQLSYPFSCIVSKPVVQSDHFAAIIPLYAHHYVL